MSDPTGYRVLARKYRPATFADLVGQDAMVRTLRNAFAANRIAQAFVLTGIRGTGKTSTARIIAKGMNCTGPDGDGGPTTDPCGRCPHCVAIGKGGHVDVIEMDAASNTGIDNIRANIIDSVSYAPTQARYKIYIIDEVHMLSTSAFNALLKTLEEPPAHVKFIFATTEIRKVPVTVLSRCQRFDLRRIEPEEMMALLARIAAAEGAQISEDALALITRAAEGSARDATSLLDQAISHGQGETGAEAVRAMLGLADRGRVLDLFDMVLRGDAAAALNELAEQYADGADPLSVMRDLAEITHWISVIKVTPDAADDPTVPPDTRARGRSMAETLSLRVLGRMWQMLLRVLDEITGAPNAMMAAEMALIRMTHVADLPAPEELIRRLQDSAATPAGPDAPAVGPVSRAGTASAQKPQGLSPHAAARGPDRPPPPLEPQGIRREPGPRAPAPEPAIARIAGPAPAPATLPDFDAVVAMIRARREVKLLLEIEDHLRLVSFAPGRIAFQPGPDAPPDLAQRLGQRLQAWTGSRWTISVAASGGGSTISETRTARDLALKQAAEAHPLFAAVAAAFPGARVARVRSRADLLAEASREALPESPDEDDPGGEADAHWDPFEHHG